MVQAVDEIGRRHGLQLGVAIHSGTIYFGNVGSTQRLELTMIGDAVNTVSRMESLNKDFDTRIMLNEGVRTQLNSDFQLRDLGEVKIRGKENEVKLFAVNALESNPL